MIISKLVDRAFAFAKKAHEGQKRWGGEDYFEHHVLQVAKFVDQSAKNILMQTFEREHVITLALLHDVVEDTDITLKDIEDKFGDDIAYGVRALTRLKDQSYSDHIQFASTLLETSLVKICDLKNNYESLVRDFPDSNTQRKEKYLIAIKFLELKWPGLKQIRHMS